MIDKTDVESSLFSENGAFDQLGRKYFNQYYTSPSSDDYRKVLDTMAPHLHDWISRADIISESGIKASTVDNALRALKAKHVILQDESRSGFYRLPTTSFAVWINAQRFARARASEENESPSLFERN